MSEDKRIDYVEFPAADLDAAESFYRETFGWSFTDYGPEYRAFSDGQLNGGFFRSGLQSLTANGAALVVIYAGDLEAARDAVIENGGQMSKEIFSFPGGRRFQFLDPHGNELAVWSDR
jgi:predicted enzyme related to lactoylglutathione lyase